LAPWQNIYANQDRPLLPQAQSRSISPSDASKIKEHRGRIVKPAGDGMLVEFLSVVDAVRCAVEVRGAMLDRNADVPEDARIAPVPHDC
jgi:hypothetical protein